MNIYKKKKDTAVNTNPNNEAPARSPNQSNAHCQTRKPPLSLTPPTSMRAYYNKEFLPRPFTDADMTINNSSHDIQPTMDTPTPQTACISIFSEPLYSTIQSTASHLQTIPIHPEAATSNTASTNIFTSFNNNIN